MQFKKLYLWLLALAVLTPLGLLASGSAWGEWTSREVKQQVGFLPKGMRAVESVWSSFFPGYNIGGHRTGLLGSAGYVFSAIAGIAFIFLIFKLVAFILPDESKKQ